VVGNLQELDMLDFQPNMFRLEPDDGPGCFELKGNAELFVTYRSPTAEEARKVKPPRVPSGNYHDPKFEKDEYVVADQMMRGRRDERGRYRFEPVSGAEFQGLLEWTEGDRHQDDRDDICGKMQKKMQEMQKINAALKPEPEEEKKV
jgi:hypothetical protein